MKSSVAVVLTALLAGACAQLPAEHRACAERAEAHATRVTRAAGSPEYQAAWIGNYQDEYRRCAR